MSAFNSTASNSTDVPTSLPTTISPTLIPTFTPTFQPTSNPTGSPTSKPTSSPTNTPTSRPTSNPTSTPTSLPTFHPTNKPTFTPSFRPTFNPTYEPTYKPTLQPTNFVAASSAGKVAADNHNLVIGLSVAGAVILIALVVLIFTCWRRKKKNHIDKLDAQYFLNPSNVTPPTTGRRSDSTSLDVPLNPLKSSINRKNNINTSNNSTTSNNSANRLTKFDPQEYPELGRTTVLTTPAAKGNNRRTSTNLGNKGDPSYRDHQASPNPLKTTPNTLRLVPVAEIDSCRPSEDERVSSRSSIPDDKYRLSRASTLKWKKVDYVSMVDPIGDDTIDEHTGNTSHSSQQQKQQIDENDILDFYEMQQQQTSLVDAHSGNTTATGTTDHWDNFDYFDEPLDSERPSLMSHPSTRDNPRNDSTFSIRPSERI